MDSSGNMIELNIKPNKKEYTLYISRELRRSSITIKSTGVLLLTQPEEYKRLSKKLENDRYMFVGHKGKSMIYFGCKKIINRGQEYLINTSPGSRIIQVVVTDNLKNNKIPEIVATSKKFKYTPAYYNYNNKETIAVINI